ncbi:VWA domain-containing protein [Nocardioides sp. R-C-SC26]|uniref:vWA domain-containing protein n=1 Tax=Nocardioides sp. R-C-SC26 TaxID=2870414 RepID=UPI001E299060|nr:VWA domain-containing protein [Nocardioides sp. R-C-SC26]
MTDLPATQQVASDRLGGAVARTPLHFVFVLDLSGSMLRGGRIQALNNAIAEALPSLRDEARANPHAELLVRVLGFADEPRWIIEQPTPIEQLRWDGVEAVPQGFTELGSALTTLAEAMAELDVEGGRTAYPPALVLVSDGRPTQSSGVTFAEGLHALLEQRWGAAAVRLALGVGRDADMNALRRFIGNEEVPLLRADNPEQLVEYIVWASKAASQVASRPVIGRATAPGVAGTTRVPPAPIGDPIWSQTL